MDEIKLKRWKESFEIKANEIEMEFNAFLKDKEFSNYYSLKMDTRDELYLKLSDELPHEVSHRLIKLFEETRPEDSV